MSSSLFQNKQDTRKNVNIAGCLKLNSRQLYVLKYTHLFREGEGGGKFNFISLQQLKAGSYELSDSRDGKELL